MRKLIVNIERNGSMVYVGEIIGANQSDASFLYAESYLADKASRPISISLPLQNSPYSPQETKNFFLSLQKKNTKCQDNIIWLICSLF